jgi:hypothetical protein
MPSRDRADSRMSSGVNNPNLEAKKLVKTGGERFMSFLKGLINFLKVAGPVIFLCTLWCLICTRRENMMAAIHELSEIGLSSVIYHHDQAFDN